jgi:hypothetical protein
MELVLILPISGNEVFNYFFTLVTYFGLAYIPIAMIIRVIMRS